MAIDWSIEQLQKAIDEIILAERLVEIQSSDGILDMLFKYPSRQEIRKADVHFRKIFHAAVTDKHLTEEQMEKIIRERKIWTEEDDEVVKDFREKIQKWKEKLKDKRLTQNAKDIAIDAIQRLEEKIYKAEYKKEVMMTNTAERKARQAKYEYLIWSSSYDPETDQRYWDNYLTFCRVRDEKLKGSLLGEFLKYLGGRTTEEIRYIARSNLWRISYVVAQKTNTPLFSKAVIELTPDQTNLSWWTGYYDSIWQMMPEDQPDDATIDDDEALDKYMDELHKERTKERQAAKIRKGNPFGSKSASAMKEQLIMRDHPKYEDLEYDQVPSTQVKGDATDKSLKDEAPAGSKAAKRRTTPIKGSKRFKKE